MTNRIPLIVNAGAAQIQEVSATDVLTVPGTLTANVVRTDHYQYANGQPFTGGGLAGLPLANGTSNFDIATADGNATITVNSSNTWTFGTDGNITLPADGGTGAATVTINFAGVGYTTQANVPTNALTGTGSGMTVDIVASTSGSNPITSVTINQAGTGYAPGDSIQVAQPSSTGNGTLVVASVTPLTSPSINYANGQPYGGGGTANTGNVTFDNINIIGTGNLHLQPDPANAGSYLDIFLTSGPDLHLVASANANLILGKDAGANVMTSYDGNVYIQSWNGINANIWTFGADGSLILPGGAVLTSANDTLVVNDNFSIGAYSNNTRLQPTQTDATVEIATLATGTIDPSIWSFGTNGSTIFPTLTIQRGDNPSGTISGQTLLFGDGTQEAIISTPDGSNADGINSQRLVINPGKGEDSNGGEGGDIYLWAGRGGDNNGSGGDVKIRGGQGMGDGTGGYIRMEAGDSQANGQPGWIEITGGQGGTTSGGYVQITGGVGGSGTGGAVDIIGGFGQAGPGAAVSITGGGSANGLAEYGNVNIGSGASTWSFRNNGTTTFPTGNITSDTSLQLTTTFGNYRTVEYQTAGVWDVYVEDVATGPNDAWSWIDVTFKDNLINKPQVFIENQKASDGIPLRWTFDENGNLTLPSGGVVSEGAAPTGLGNTIAITPSGGSDANQQLLVYPTGNIVEGNHLHLTTGNLYNTELFLGNDNLYVKLANTGNVVINSNDATGNSAQWTFGVDGNLTVPGNILGGGNILIAPDSANSGGYLDIYLSTGPDVHVASNGDSNLILGRDDSSNVTVNTDGNVTIQANTSTPHVWKFDSSGNLNVPQGGYIGAAGVKGDGTMLTGGAGNVASLTSFYADAPGVYSSCVTANPDGTLNITTYGNGTGQLGQWTFSSANLLLASQNVSGNAGESALLEGTRKIVNGQYSGAAYGYSAELAAGGTPSIAYTATNEYVQSVRLTFAVESVGSNPQWEQFDVVATKSLDTPGSVNFVVSNRIKARASIADTTVTATINLANEIEISLNLDAAQTSGWSSFDAVEFGVMFN
jgi:hypothetical protein